MTPETLYLRSRRGPPPFSSTEHPMNNGRAVVLVVEDSTIVRMGAVDLVLAAGYEALEAGDADEAIRILEMRTDIDLVFTDVQMPGTMDGIKLAHFIRDRWPPVKLIVASGNAILEESGLPGGSRFFAKPYADHAITDAMARLLASDDPKGTATG